MNYKNFSLGDWICHISGVIEEESTLDGNEMRDLVEFLSKLPRVPDQHGWYLVDDKLPSNEEEVLLFLENTTKVEMGIGYYHVDCNVYPGKSEDEIDTGWYDKNDEWILKPVIAWMPLPKPPKRVESQFDCIDPDNPTPEEREKAGCEALELLSKSNLLKDIAMFNRAFKD